MEATTTATTNRNQYMTVLETAQYLGVSKRFVYNAIASGELKHYKKSYRLIRIKISDADKFMQLGEMGGDEGNN